MVSIEGLFETFLVVTGPLLLPAGRVNRADLEQP